MPPALPLIVKPFRFSVIEDARISSPLLGQGPISEVRVVSIVIVSPQAWPWRGTGASAAAQEIIGKSKARNLGHLLFFPFLGLNGVLLSNWFPGG